MATVYRDYGTLSGRTFPENMVTTRERRQVYQATHGGDDQRLPYMHRSFISFTYGGKHIEDFDLIATINGDRWQRDGYSSFDDTTTTYDNLDGQKYWSTHYKTNSINFQLSTDGIDLLKLDEFLHWFSAGLIRELILSEHPNRAQLARVADTPKLLLLPFEHHTTMIISGNEYPVITTLYKGEIELTLIMDEPHWYAKDNILGIKDTANNRYINDWIDANGNLVNIFASLDALKILYEDGIPLGSMIQDDMLLGNGAFAKVSDNVESQVWTPSEEDIVWTEGVPSGYGARIMGTKTDEEYWHNSLVVMATLDNEPLFTLSNDLMKYNKEPGFIEGFTEIPAGDYVGIIAGPIIDASGNGVVSFPPFVPVYFFYAGTAPSPTTISFDVMPTFDQYKGYCTTFYSTYYNDGTPYNTITIGSVNKLEFKFTTPNLITSYNRAVEIMLEKYWDTNLTFNDLRDMVKEIKHPAVRAWTNALLKEYGIPSDQNSFGRNSHVTQDSIRSKMVGFFLNDDKEYEPMHFVFNSKTGEATGNFLYRKPTLSMPLYNILYEENALNKLNTIRTEDNHLNACQRYENLVTWGWDIYCIINGEVYVPEDLTDTYLCNQAVRAFINYVDAKVKSHVSIPTIFTVSENILTISELVHATEDVGDMLRSNNIIIRDRNYPSPLGNIVVWNSDNGLTYSHYITHNVASGLQKFLIIYQTMYL